MGSRYVYISLFLVILLCGAESNVIQNLFNVVAGSGSEVEKAPEGRPEFCGEYECPEFSVVKSYDGFELRDYANTTWVYVSIPQTRSIWGRVIAYRKAYVKLAKYFGGNNAAGQKIPRTVPVLVMHAGDDNVAMNFLLPKQFVENTPTPNDSDVKLYMAARAQYYVRSFGGYAYLPGNTFRKNYGVLTKKLQAQSLTYDTGLYFAAEFNAPWDVFNRHNEIMVVKK